MQLEKDATPHERPESGACAPLTWNIRAVVGKGSRSGRRCGSVLR